MRSKEKFRYKKRKHKVVNISFLLVGLIMIIALITTSYAKWNTSFNINGYVTGQYQEPQLQVNPVKAEGATGDRITVNTTLTGGLFQVSIFQVIGDTIEGNTITTSLQNGTKRWINGDITPTFTIAIQNNSGSTFTNGNVTYSESDSQDYITPMKQELSATTVENGSTVTLTCQLSLRADADINVGSYAQYKIEFTVDGVKRYYYYKILIAQ